MPDGSRSVTDLMGDEATVRPAERQRTLKPILAPPLPCPPPSWAAWMIAFSAR
ncbi:MAG: hypothetical protein SA339_07955 [Methanomassiliicoccus sp.]|nr:hypothetical protein [Methanomassiliicoccus sp.]